MVTAPQENQIFEDNNFDPSNHLQMSVILITPDNFETLRYTVQALQRQSVRELLELVIVVSSLSCLQGAESEFECFGSYQAVEIENIGSNAAARAAGVFNAHCPVIVFTEDHCFPAPNWAETLINRHRESWTGVGPMVYNANPNTAVSRANFWIEYGEWIAQTTSKKIGHIPGHNSSYKREALLEYGTELETMLKASSPMQWDMTKRGHTFFIETDAKTYHLNFSLFWASVSHRFYAGRLFAASRLRQWTGLKRLVYFLGSTLIPFVRLGRILRDVIKIGQQPFIRKTFPSLIILLIADGMGEVMGYATGKAGKSNQVVSDREFHHKRFLVEQDKKLLADIGKITAANK